MRRVVGASAFVGSISVLTAIAGCSSDPDTTGVSTSPLTRAKDCPTLLAALQEDALEKLVADAVSPGAAAAAGPLVAGPGSRSDSEATLGGSGARNYSTTLTQVAGIDEADIVKTDGKFLYALHGSELQVFNAYPVESLALVSTVALEGIPVDFFLSDGKATIVSEVEGSALFSATDTPARNVEVEGYGPTGDAHSAVRFLAPLTKVTVVQFGEIPTIAHESYFEGTYVSSRRDGTLVRLVLSGRQPGPSLQGAVSLEEKKTRIRSSSIEAWLPRTFSKKGSAVEGAPVACTDFFLPPKVTVEPGLTTVHTLNLDHLETRARSFAMQGFTDAIYQNGGTLVLATRSWVDPAKIAQAAGGLDKPSTPSPGGFDGGVPTGEEDGGMRMLSLGLRETQLVPHVSLSKTAVHLFDLPTSSTEIAYVASQAIEGRVSSPYAIDVKDGTLRVVTTTTELEAGQAAAKHGVLLSVAKRPAGQTGLEISGVVLEGNAVESATRFIGDHVLVSAERGGEAPLFVFNTSKSTPERVGSTNLRGKGSFLLPVGPNLVATLGREGSGATSTLALRLLDIRDFAAPTISDSFVAVGPGGSDAELNPKALTYFADKGVLGFPYVSVVASAGGVTVSSLFQVFRIDGNQLSLVGALDHSDAYGSLLNEPVSEGRNPFCDETYYSPAIRRGVFFDDALVTLSQRSIRAHKLSGLTLVRSVALSAPTSPTLTASGSSSLRSDSGLACLE